MTTTTIQHTTDIVSELVAAEEQLNATKAAATLTMLENMETAFQLAVRLGTSVVGESHRCQLRDLINMIGGYNSDDGRQVEWDALRDAASLNH